MPLTRRVPKRGFTNPFREAAQVVGLDDLARLAGTEVTVETLAAVGLCSANAGPVKLLANGSAARAYTVRGLKVSGAARDAIVAAGGTVENDVRGELLERFEGFQSHGLSLGVFVYVYDYV